MYIYIYVCFIYVYTYIYMYILISTQHTLSLKCVRSDVGDFTLIPTLSQPCLTLIRMDPSILPRIQNGKKAHT